MLLIFMTACVFAFVAHFAGWLDDNEESPAELQLDEGHGNYMAAGAEGQPTQEGRL